MLRNKRGMTLIEILIVLAIIGTMMATLAPRIVQNFKKANMKQARLMMGELGKGLDQYYTDCGSYPSSEQGLKALIDAPGSGCANWGPDPYVNKKLLKDPWNEEWEYTEHNGTYTLRSIGKNGKHPDISSDDDGGTGEKSDK
jgi:general secretion pathway protein G